jgi:hypothetical protein
MIRCFLSQLLGVLLVLSVPTALPGKATDQGKPPTIREQLVLMQPGTIVEVKTKSKEKFIGRLGALTADSFEVQIPKGKSIEKQTVGFDEVKSVKIREHFGMSRGAKTSLWILAGAGILYFVLWLVIRQVPPMG